MNQLMKAGSILIDQALEQEWCRRRVPAIGRPGDFVGRYGGEEFVVLLPECDPKGALEMAEKIRSYAHHL